MPSLPTHAVAALGIGACFYRSETPKSVWVIGAVCSVIPDLDVIGFSFGIRYGDFWGHRGFAHSLAGSILDGSPSGGYDGQNHLQKGAPLYCVRKPERFLDFTDLWRLPGATRRFDATSHPVSCRSDEGMAWGEPQMIPTLPISALSTKWPGKMLVAVLAASFIIPSLAAPNKAEQNCGGLHAAIRGELVRRDPPYTQPPFIMLTFILLNDSEKPINAVEGGWKIVIDGKELEDSDFIFVNGPQPGGGWGTLNPGESYHFGKALELSRYFPEEREYRLSWKGKAFRSSTITVRVTPKR